MDAKVGKADSKNERKGHILEMQLPDENDI